MWVNAFFMFVFLVFQIATSNFIEDDQYVVISTTLSSHRKKTPQRNCQEIKGLGTNTSGIYFIKPDYDSEGFMVMCDMETRDGGWTYLLNRYDGFQNFYLGWNDYQQGFGNLAGEFWLGLEYLHRLTKYETNELLVELVDWDLNKVYAHYALFGVGNEKEGYSLKILDGYSGDAGDALAYHAGSKFSTNDRDQDGNAENCASKYNGAWWYNTCMHSQLTGQYHQGNVTSDDEGKIIYWKTFHGINYSLKEARMMIRANGRS